MSYTRISINPIVVFYSESFARIEMHALGKFVLIIFDFKIHVIKGNLKLDFILKTTYSTGADCSGKR